MKAGDLKDLIKLFEPGAPIDDGMATVEGPPISRGERWSKFMHRGVNETFESAGLEGEAVALFLVHSDSMTRAIQATWTLVYQGATYHVIGTSPWKQDGILVQAKAGD